jgi:hypothetical protein
MPTSANTAQPWAARPFALHRHSTKSSARRAQTMRPPDGGCDENAWWHADRANYRSSRRGRRSSKGANAPTPFPASDTLHSPRRVAAPARLRPNVRIPSWHLISSPCKSILLIHWIVRSASIEGRAGGCSIVRGLRRWSRISELITLLKEAIASGGAVHMPRSRGAETCRRTPDNGALAAWLNHRALHPCQKRRIGNGFAAPLADKGELAILAFAVRVSERLAYVARTGSSVAAQCLRSV